jgi:hypothetical protein
MNVSVCCLQKFQNSVNFKAIIQVITISQQIIKIYGTVIIIMAKCYKDLSWFFKLSLRTVSKHPYFHHFNCIRFAIVNKRNPKLSSGDLIRLIGLQLNKIIDCIRQWTGFRLVNSWDGLWVGRLALLRKGEWSNIETEGVAGGLCHCVNLGGWCITWGQHPPPPFSPVASFL